MFFLQNTKSKLYVFFLFIIVQPFNITATAKCAANPIVNKRTNLGVDSGKNLCYKIVSLS